MATMAALSGAAAVSGGAAAGAGTQLVHTAYFWLNNARIASADLAEVLQVNV